MKRLKTVLINLDIPGIEDPKRQPPNGLVSIATYITQSGFDVEVIDLALDPKTEIPIADVYGFSTYTVNYLSAVELSRSIRSSNPQSVHVAGGHHASALPELVAQDFDFVIIGEGESAFLSLLHQIKKNDGPETSKIIENDPISDVDLLPFADHNTFTRLSHYTRKIEGVPAVCIDSSRGCNFRCRFCNSRVFKRGEWRARSARNIFNEICLYHDLGWRAVRFNDDNFLVDEMRVLELCKLLEPLKIKFRIFCRAESLTNALCEQLAKSGCRHIAVGIESLSAPMLANMGKGESVQQIINGIMAANRVGISVRGFFICGFPGETETTIDESISNLSKIVIDEAVVYPCIPYPGTVLYHDRERFGITWIDPDFSKFIQVGRNRNAGFVMRTNSFGPDEVHIWREKYMNAFSDLGIAWAAEKEKIV